MAKLLLLFVICVGLLPVAVQAQENTEFIPGEVWKDTDGNPINAMVAGFFITMALTIGMVNIRKEKPFCPNGLRGNVIVRM